MVLPCLDESGALPWVLGRIPPGWRAIVVDNGSRDGSAELARSLGATVVEEPRRGFGAACHTGLRAATADLVCFLDCDGSLDPAQLPRVVAPVLDGAADLVLGRRRPATAGAWPVHARLANAVLARRLRLARTLALAGGDALVHSRRDRLAAVQAAERTGDLSLTARIIGAYDVPALWSRADDPEQSRAVVAAAERTITALGPDGPADLSARLLATIAVESRSADLSGTEPGRARQAARRAEALARDLADPALLAFALNGVFLQSFTRPGLAAVRDRTGAEILDLATRHALPNFAVLGRLIRLQSASALGDLDTATSHAEAAEQLAATIEAPLVPVLTGWFRARVTAARSTEPGGPTAATAAAHYRAAENALRTAGMPGLHRGLFPLALLGLRLLHDRPAPTDPHLDWGPYRPWARPLVLLAQDRTEEARAALATVPEPPRDHMQEAMWCLTVRAAVRLGAPGIAARAQAALRDACAEHAGATSGMVTLGPVARYLAEAEACAGAG